MPEQVALQSRKSTGSVFSRPAVRRPEQAAGRIEGRVLEPSAPFDTRLRFAPA